MKTGPKFKTNVAAFLSMALLAMGLAAPLIPSNSHAAETKPYPLNVCVVSGNELGSMGTPITRKYGDQEVKFCCKPCIKKFEKDPEKYLGKLKK